MAPKESQGGQVNSAKDIWACHSGSDETTEQIITEVTDEKFTKIGKNTYFFI